MDIDAFHLPDGFASHPRTSFIERDEVRVLTPILSDTDLDDICRRLIAAQEVLLRMPAARVIDAIDRAARRLRDPAEPVRTDVLHALTAVTGYSGPMAAYVLDRMAEDWLAPALRRLLDAELGGPDAIESFVTRPGGARIRAVAPPLGFHVFSGNVPGVSVTSIVRALLVRSAVLGKPAAGEPVLAAAFVRLLAECDPDVGACAAVTYWPGGDQALEAAVLRHADLVVHYGGSSAIASLRERAGSNVQFVEHGPRISFAIVGADAGADAGTAADLARATAVFDQQGCVSPQLAYVIGDADTGRRFAARVAAALHDLHDELPRGRLDAADASAAHSFRTRAEFAAIGGQDVELWSGPGLRYSVVFTADPSFEGTCLNRTLLVKCAASLDDIIARAAPFRHLLQTVGIAGFTDDAVALAAKRLARIGVTRIAPLSTMPWPPVTWHHDGRGPLTELVRWVDLEL